MNKSLKSALCLIIVAVLLFIVSSIDSIELVGKYEMIEIMGIELSELSEQQYDDEDAVKAYMTFNLFGQVSMDSKYSKAVKDQIDEEEAQLGMEEAFDGQKWSAKSGEIEFKSGDETESNNYTLKGKELIIESQGVEIKLEKTFLGSLVSPSGLLRIVAVILLLAAGLVFLSGKGKEDGGVDWKMPTSFSGGPSVSARCSNCGAVVAPGNKFCQACGTPVEAAPETPVMMTQRCDRCGTPINSTDKFCQGCGAPVGGAAEAPAYEPAPVYEEPAPVYQEPAPVYEEPAPVYQEPAPAYEETVPAPAPAPTPAPAPAPTPDPTPAPGPSSGPASTHSRFTQAGDL